MLTFYIFLLGTAHSSYSSPWVRMDCWTSKVPGLPARVCFGISWAVGRVSLEEIIVTAWFSESLLFSFYSCGVGQKLISYPKVFLGPWDSAKFRDHPVTNGIPRTWRGRVLKDQPLQFLISHFFSLTFHIRLWHVLRLCEDVSVCICICLC